MCRCVCLSTGGVPHGFGSQVPLVSGNRFFSRRRAPMSCHRFCLGVRPGKGYCLTKTEGTHGQHRSNPSARTLGSHQPTWGYCFGQHRGYPLARAGGTPNCTEPGRLCDVGSMPLAFTQEDFLLEIFSQKLPRPPKYTAKILKENVIKLDSFKGWVSRKQIQYDS